MSLGARDPLQIEAAARRVLMDARNAPNPLDEAARSAVSLTDVLETFKKWLYLPDPGVVTLTLAAVAANRLEGRPVWLLLVGPPSSGKTEILDSLLDLPDMHPASVLTEAALLSGSPSREKTKESTGGLLRKIGAFGCLIMKDFTSILAMHTEQRAAVLAALREIYDGAWTRHVGTDKGQTLSWIGKCAFLGGVTPILDQHHGVIAGMGERFLLSRMPKVDAEKQARRSIQHLGYEREMRRALRECVGRLFERFTPTPLDLDDAEAERLAALATLAAKCRSSVERDARNREIELVPDSELPARLAQALARVGHGMQLIGAPEEEALRLTQKVALDSMPATRMRVLQILLADANARSTPSVATAMNYPTTTIRRTCEDLAAHGILLRTSQGQGKPDLWEVSDAARGLWDRASLPNIPEKSGGA
jgi:hypothetical protein